jgi:hypothetical protein
VEKQTDISEAELTYKEREIIKEREQILDRRKKENKTKKIMYFYFSSKI